MQFIQKNKTLIQVLVLFYLPVSSKAQVYSSTPSSNLSGTIGITASRLTNDSIHYSTGFLFNAGFVYSLRLSEKLNANIELLYTGKGVKTEKPIVKYRYYYVDIPLYVQYNLNSNCRINAGAQYSIFTNSFVSQIDGSNTNGINKQKYNNIKNTDYSFLLGAEIDMSEKLTLTGRYALSAATLFNQNEISFGVFTIAFKYTLASTYKQFFSKANVEEKAK